IPFSADWRERIVKSLEFYEEWMVEGGFVDASALSLLASRHIDDFEGNEHPFRYRSILVDEEQDLGTVELMLLRALCVGETDGIFLAGDAKQLVFPKQHDLNRAGIRLKERKYFRKNYRNTKEILEAAYH